MFKQSFLVTCALLFCLQGTLTGQTTTVVISHPRQVDDVILRQAELTYRDELFWTHWNFGASQVLCIGFAAALWNQWRGNVLIRFDMRGVDITEVKNAKFRIYKPTNITQMSQEVPIGFFRVKEVNADWVEGNSDSKPQAEAASWQYRRDGIPWAGGNSGAGVTGVDYYPEPLWRGWVSKFEGKWIEFELPPDLVQRWIDYPEKNAGLLIKTVAAVEVRADNVLFYSSEHSSGKGPQLIVEGRQGPARHAADPNKRYNPQAVMPIPTDEEFYYWAEHRNFRAARWATCPVVNMTREQRIYPFYWDIVVKGDFVLPYSYFPFSQSLLGLDEMIANRDYDGLRQFQLNRLRYLHIWEHIRGQRWYMTGDIMEFLSPLQAAYLWLGSMENNGLTFNAILGAHPKGRANDSQRDIQLRRTRRVAQLAENLTLTEDQFNVIERHISHVTDRRTFYRNKCNMAAQAVHRLMAEKNDGREMFEALGRFMIYHHIYLYYDSFWQMKNWPLLNDIACPVELAIFWRRQKYREYSPARMQRRFEACARFFPEAYGPLEIKIRNTLWLP